MIHPAAIIAAIVLQTPSAPRNPTIDDLAFLTGTWRGESEGLRYEEAWLPPAGGNMSAVYRTVNPEGVQLLEILTFAEVEGGLVYRLRHFDKALTPWPSEADGPTESAVEFIDSDSIRCANADPESRVTAVTYDREGDTLTARVIFNESVGRDPIELVFELVSE